MDGAVLIALAALVGSLLSTLATIFGGPAFQARREARRVLDAHREPLLAASYELQARLHNILRNDFVGTYVTANRAGKRDAALQSTLYVFAQFFGWREIIRREVQFLRFSEDEQTRAVTSLLRSITETFLSDQFGSQFMIWRAEQRGFGERLIVTSDGRPTCMGYASFIAQRATMREWLDPLERDLKQIGLEGKQRLTKLQHLLLELVRALDAERTHYPSDLEMA
jgi:hypothetical protein